MRHDSESTTFIYQRFDDSNATIDVVISSAFLLTKSTKLMTYTKSLNGNFLMTHFTF